MTPARSFAPDKFAAYALRQPIGWEAEARAQAIITAEAIEIPGTVWDALRAKYHPDSPPPPSRGLGDVVALFAEPIARASDAVLGTKLVGCNACAERRAALNRLMPKL